MAPGIGFLSTVLDGNKLEIIWKNNSNFHFRSTRDHFLAEQ
jgi:hypothetical protein